MNVIIYVPQDYLLSVEENKAWSLNRLKKLLYTKPT